MADLKQARHSFQIPKTSPERTHARQAVPFTSHVAAQATDPDCGLLQRGYRLLRCRELFVEIRVQRAPFQIRQDVRTGRFRSLARRISQVDHPYRQRGEYGYEFFQPLRRLELKFLDFVAALEGQVHVFYSPATFVPIHYLERLLESVDLKGGPKQPMQRFAAR